MALFGPRRRDGRVVEERVVQLEERDQLVRTAAGVALRRAYALMDGRLREHK